MSFVTRLTITRPSITTPFFNEILPKDPANPIRASFSAIEDARARAGFAQTEKLSPDGLTRTVEIDYGTSKVYNSFLSKYQKDFAVMLDARRAYYGTAGIEFSYSVPKE